MKKLLFLLIVICFCVNAVSQNGFYATKSNFISLTEVQEKRLYKDSNNNMTGWTPGTYVLRAVVGDEVYSEKLLVK